MTIKLDKIILNSFIMAFYLCLFYINAIVMIEGIGIVTLACVFALFAVSAVYGWIKTVKGCEIVVIYILSLFFFSILRNGFNSLIVGYLLKFVTYGIIGIIIGMQDINISSVVKMIIAIGIAGSPLMLVKGYDWFLTIDPTRGVAMGLSYALLPLLIASLIGLRYRLRWKLLSFYLVYIIIWFYIKLAPRGVLLAVGIFILIVFYYNFYVQKHRRNIVLFPFLIIIGGMTGALCFVKNIAPIMMGIKKILELEFGIQIFALNKFVYYIEKGDVSNNRFDLWNNGWNLAQTHLLTGNGIGRFEIENGTYTHNIFLQSINEGGVFMLILVCVLLAAAVIWLLFVRGTNVNREQYFFMGLLFVAGAFPLLYSSVYWIMNPFWIFLGYVITHIGFKIKKKMLWCIIRIK